MTGSAKYLLFALSLTGILAVSACGGKPKETAAPARQPNRPVQAEGFVVKTRALSENLEVPGSLIPFETTQIRPEISGRIVQLDFREGSVVRKGTVLARLFDGDLQAQLNKLQVQLSIAEKTVERQKALLDISGISQQEYDLSQLQANNLKADIQLVRVAIAKTRIVAPYTGKMGLRNVSLGAYVTPADILTTISQVDDLKLEFTVPEKYSEAMVKGKNVAFTVSGTNEVAQAEIIATESTIAANTRSLTVRAVVRNPGETLVPGGFANVRLQLDETQQPLVVPTQAVIPQARDKRVIRYRNGSPEFQVVTTGIRDSTFVQIVDGLQLGDTVITTGLLAIRPESKVTLTRVQ